MNTPELNEQLDIPRPPGVIREFMRRNPLWVDGTLAALYLLSMAALTVLEGFLPSALGDPIVWTTPTSLTFPHGILLIGLAAVGAMTAFTRRQYPLISLIVLLVISAPVSEEMISSGAATFALAVLLYSVPVYGSVRAGWIGYGATVVISLVLIALKVQITGIGFGAVTEMIFIFVGTALITLVPVMVGINSGNRQRYTAAIIDRAHQLARERDQLARLAVVEERTRIAREMHDIVAHSVSVMVTLSEGAARVVDSDPAAAKSAMKHSAEAGRSALGEMRRLIGVLRDDEGALQSAELAPTAGIDTLPDLIQDFRMAGLTVQLTIRGAQSDAVEGAHQARDLAVYRTVQEALTNALRYAGPGATVRIAVEQGTAFLTVKVEDDGGILGHAAMAGVGSGQGLIGLAERLRVFGGQLTHGPTIAGGWLVTATLPSTEPDGHRKAGDD